MRRTFTRWLESFGKHIMQHGWSDPYGTSIAPWLDGGFYPAVTNRPLEHQPIPEPEWLPSPEQGHVDRG